MINTFIMGLFYLYVMIILLRYTGTVCCLVLWLASCNTENQKQALRKREMALEQREQQLQAREQELSLREAAFAAKVQAADSTRTADTLQTAPAALTGTWNVQMTCTETSCAGSAIGDVKTEQWQLTNENNTLVARATAKGQLVRVYTGTYHNGAIELSEERASAADPALAQMVVRLKPVSPTRMEGQREIIRENDCRILYALQLEALNQ